MAAVTNPKWTVLIFKKPDWAAITKDEFKVYQVAFDTAATDMVDGGGPDFDMPAFVHGFGGGEFETGLAHPVSQEDRDNYLKVVPNIVCPPGYEFHAVAAEGACILQAGFIFGRTPGSGPTL